jgi:hypothetical protein
VTSEIKASELGPGSVVATTQRVWLKQAGPDPRHPTYGTWVEAATWATWLTDAQFQRALDTHLLPTATVLREVPPD